MADADCMAVNPTWHDGHNLELVFTTGPVKVICKDCLVHATVADTYDTKQEIVRGREAVRAFRKVKE